MNQRQWPCLVPVALAVALAGCDSKPQPPPSPAAKASVAAPARPASTLAAEPKPEPSAPAIAPPDAPVALVGPAFAPRDDCSAKPGWPAFRKALASAIRRRDAQALVALATPDIALDYGGGSGIAELKKRLADPDTGLWQELAAIMPLGCAMEGGLAAMPWVFWNVPETLDSYNAMLVLGDATPLFDKPGGKKADSKEIGTIGWSIVGIDPMAFDPHAPETRVTLESGKKGWVQTARLRSLLDYRLIAEPRDGTWRVTAFIAGD